MGIKDANGIPDPYPTPHRERRAGDVTQNHPSHLVSKLQAPGTQKREEQRRVDDRRTTERRIEQP